MENIPYKTSKFVYSPAKFPHIAYISTFPSNSFYMCLGVGILELIARFKNHEDYIRALIIYLQNHKTESITLSNQDSQYVQNYYKFFDYILTISPFEGLNCIKTYIEKPSNYAIVQSIEKGFKYILASMIEKSKKEKISKIISGENIDSLAYSLLLKAADSLCIKIERYKIVHDSIKNDFDVEKDDFISRSLGKYPIMHLVMHSNIYYLAYSEAMVEQENNENFNQKLLDDYPFLDKQNDFDENEYEQSILGTIPKGNDSKSLAFFLVKSFARELKKNNLVNKDIILIVQECLRKNSELESIEELRSLSDSSFDLCSKEPTESSIQTEHIIKNCSFCKRPYQSDLKYKCPDECSVCFMCRKSDPFYCIQCRRCYTKQETSSFSIE
ncbi:hypothetical protein SteCoe_29354 [Stentor coeruleus]|uniref:Uncharacterized protein n=1 Tax=Stentor coeruleus TaxID=5963 RepID=A0A1R2B624_9CILI|nr:hypothetical protein SteCoe_29354 [Stentor coeruleus]